MIMWKEFIDNYAISDNGEVKNITTGRILYKDVNSKGYYRVNIRKRHYLIHRLVAIHYISNPNNLPQVNHKDHDKLNNCRNNLEWCTNKYNTEHGYLDGRKSGNTKLSPEAIEYILSVLNDKSLSVKDLAKKYNVAIPTIYAIKQGLNMKRLKE